MDRLKERRQAKGMKQSDLAKALNLSQTVISLLETNDIEPGATLRRKIDEILGEDTKKEGVKKMTQNERVLAFMQDHGEISQRDAVQFGCYRLSARIKNLRDDGHHIITENRGFRNEYGCGHYAVYKLAEV